jgi:hypothetical protein
MGAILSFLGGSAFRFIIGHLVDYFQKKQDHQYELERIASQEKIDQAAADRQLAMIRLQSDLKMGEIKLAGEAQVNVTEANAFVEAMKVANTPTGFKLIDAWNGSIRPAAATISLTLWFLKLLQAAFVLTDWDQNLVASILGYFFADRHIGKSKA